LLAVDRDEAHAGGMTRVDVFIDDAVQGRLPGVCAKTGVPSAGKLRIEQSTGGLGFGWLLLFLGPIGWIGLVLWLVFSSRSGVLTVRLPYSDAAVDHEWRLRRIRFRVTALAILGFGVALAIQRSPATWVLSVVAAGLILVALVAHVRLMTERVGVRLDASRRWVTLTRVHPDFVRAVEQLSNAETLTRG
jgi:hypothetical protein